MRRLNCFHCLLLVKSPRCASVLGWPFSQNTGSWATGPWPRCLEPREDSELQWGASSEYKYSQLLISSCFLYCDAGSSRLQAWFSAFRSLLRTIFTPSSWCSLMLLDFQKIPHSARLSAVRAFYFPALNSGFILFITSKTLRWYPDLDLIDSLSGIFLDFPPCIRRDQNWKFRIQSLFELWHEISLPWRELRDAAPAPAHYW